MIRRTALLVGLLYAAAATAQGPEGETLLLDLCVDRVCEGLAVVVLRGEEVLVERDALARAGVNLEGAPTVAIGTRAFVSTANINHGTTFALDRAMLRLDIARPAESLPPQRASFRTQRAPLAGARDWSAYLNYAASIADRSDAHSLFLDGAVTRGTWSLSTDALWMADEGLRRGLTRLDIDQPDHLRRWSVGDQFAASPDPLGGGALLGGVGVQRAFDLDPFLTTYPQPYLSGVLETPGTVEIYANGALVGRQPLQAGPFSLEGLGLTQGRNDVRLLLRDPFGNTRELFTTAYYSASGLLAPGLTEYALRAGLVRTQGLEDRYSDDPALAGFWRRGLSERVTLGARIEADDSLRNAGASAAVRLPVGELTGALAHSRDDGMSGRAYALGYQYVSRLIGLSLGGRRLDAGYRRLGDEQLLGPDRRILQDAYATVSWSATRGVSLQANWGLNRFVDGPDERRVGVSGTYRMGRRAQLQFALARRRTGAVDATEGLLGLSFALDREQATVLARHDEDGIGYGASLSRSRPSDVGLGYDVNVNRVSGENVGFGRVEYQSRFGRYAVSANHFAGETSGQLLASGALVGIGGRVFATPPVDNAFALVRLPGVPGVRVRRENLPVGVTDEQGDLLVRNLLPYYPNRIGYDDSDVPMDYRAGASQRAVAVPRNGGALVAFDVAPLRAISGRIVLPGIALEPGESAQVRLRRGESVYETQIGASGRYYLEDVAAGTYDVDVEYAQGRARCVLTVPEAAPGIQRLVDLVCETAVEERNEPQR